MLRQAEIIEGMSESQESSGNVQYAQISQQHLVPIGNLSRWWKNREAITQRADELRQRMLMGARQRRNSDRTSSLHIHWKYNQSLEPLLKYIEAQIKVRQESKRPVTLSFVKRACVARIKLLVDCGITPMFRGKALTASTTWCWRVMVALGYTSRRRSKIRPTSVEVLLTIINELLVCL